MIIQIPEIESDTIILTFTDCKYLPMFNIWYNYFSRHNLDNLLVVSLDDTTFKDLQSRNIRTILCEYTILVKDEFWLFRLETIFNIFTQSKKNILHTDADCIWLKDIYSLIHNQPYDFIGSISTGHPYHLAQKHGFVVCCGFYYMRYNSQMLQMLSKILTDNTYGKDDQVRFNYYMFNNVKNILSNTGDLFEKEIELQDNTKMILLKHKFVDRNNCNEETYCFHPWLCARDTAAKIKQLRSYMKNFANF
ncbi:MAG: hypothetical protein EB127_02355 [Alphaproteobacteria bacterium]|nr:hypothetical protein [Alphaproteobacteria bacterium]